MPVSQKTAMPTRHFTRAEVIAFFEKYWGVQFRKSYRDVEIISVSLLEGVTPPMWAMLIELVDNESMLLNTELTYIFTEENSLREKGKKQLNLVHEIIVPPGHATVADENKAMRERGK